MNDDEDNFDRISASIDGLRETIISEPKISVDEDDNILVDGKRIKTTVKFEKETYKLLIIGTGAAVVSSIIAIISAAASIVGSIATWKQAEIAEKTLNQNKINSENDQNIQVTKTGSVIVPVAPIVDSVNGNSIRNSSQTNAPSPKMKCKHKK